MALVLTRVCKRLFIFAWLWDIATLAHGTDILTRCDTSHKRYVSHNFYRGSALIFLVLNAILSISHAMDNSEMFSLVAYYSEPGNTEDPVRKPKMCSITKNRPLHFSGRNAK